jgi:hypothetical protein
MVGRFCSRTVTPAIPLWSVEIRELWSHLKMPVQLPKSLFALYKRMSSVDVIARIGELVDETVELIYDRRQPSNQCAPTCSIPTGAGLSKYPEVPVDTGRGRKRRVQSKQPRKPIEETDAIVGEFLKVNPFAELADVSRATGSPKTSIKVTESWARRSKNRETLKPREPRTRNLSSDRAVDFASVENDGARRAELREFLELQYIESATPNERAEYNNPLSNKTLLIEDFLKRTRSKIDEYLRVQGTDEEKAAFQQMVNQGDYQMIFEFAAQIRDNQNDRAVH